MTDRLSGFVVILEEHIREDDAEAIKHALAMTKGVLTVEPVTADVNLLIAEAKARFEIGSRVSEALSEAIRG